MRFCPTTERRLGRSGRRIADTLERRRQKVGHERSPTGLRDAAHGGNAVVLMEDRAGASGRRRPVPRRMDAPYRHAWAAHFPAEADPPFREFPAERDNGIRAIASDGDAIAEDAYLRHLRRTEACRIGAPSAQDECRRIGVRRNGCCREHGCRSRGPEEGQHASFLRRLAGRDKAERLFEPLIFKRRSHARGLLHAAARYVLAPAPAGLRFPA